MLLLSPISYSLGKFQLSLARRPRPFSEVLLMLRGSLCGSFGYPLFFFFSLLLPWVTF